MNILEHFDHYEKKQDKDHFMNLIQVALSDGVIDNEELHLLHRFGKKVGFTLPEIDSFIEVSCKEKYNPPFELSKKFEQLYDIVKMILADGIIDTNEMHYANNYATKLGFSENEIPKLLSLLIQGISEENDEETLFEIYKRIRNI